MSKPRPKPTEPPAPDPRIMFDGYKFRIIGVSRTHAPSFYTHEEAETYLEGNQP